MTYTNLNKDLITIWIYSLFILSFITLILIIYYCFKTLKFTFSTRLMSPVSFLAQIWFIIAVFIKGIGIFGSGFLLLFFFKNENYFLKLWERYSVIPGGLPGYVSSFAYCYVLNAWCRTYFDYIQASNYAEFTHKVLKYTSYSVLILFFIFLFLMIFQDPKLYHTFEAIVAITRDTIISIIFLSFIFKVKKLYEGKHTIFMYLSSTCMVIGLFSRTLSVVIYTFYFSGNNSEFESLYLIIYILFFIFSDIIPFLAIASDKLQWFTDKIQKVFINNLDESPILFFED